MTIKEVANITGLSIDSLRYYERIGVIPPIPKTKSGIREYDDHAVHWIEFVLKFKNAGASLEKIIEYIKLLNTEEDTKESRRGILFEIKDELDAKIKKLQKCSEIIEFKIENYDDLCDPIMQELGEKQIKK